MTITGAEVKNILLDYIKRVSPGFVQKDMKMLELDDIFEDVTFSWHRSRDKNI
jgi:hypothetical protein